MILLNGCFFFYSDCPGCYNYWANLFNSGWRQIEVREDVFSLPDATEICALNRVGTGHITVWIRQTGTSSVFKSFLALSEWSTASICFYIIWILSCDENTADRAAKLNLQTHAAQKPPQREYGWPVINDTCCWLCLPVLMYLSALEMNGEGNKGGRVWDLLLQIWLAALVRPQLCWIAEWINASEELKFCETDLFF